MNLEDGISSTTKLLDLADKTVLIYDGPFDPRIYQSEEVVRALRDAVARSVRIEVVCDESAQIDHSEVASMVDRGDIRVYKKKLPRNFLNLVFGRKHIDKGHYMVVDGLYTREEVEPHTVESDMRRALIKYFSERAEKLTRRFYRMRDNPR